jgi:hypothetical protein
MVVKSQSAKVRVAALVVAVVCVSNRKVTRGSLSSVSVNTFRVVPGS